MSSTKKGKASTSPKRRAQRPPGARSEAKRHRDEAAWRVGGLAATVRWAADMDYWERLSASEVEWLRRFAREYYDGSVRAVREDASEGRAGSGSGRNEQECATNQLHNTTALTRDCYNRKNAANRDLFSILNARGRIDRIGGPSSKHAPTPFAHSTIYPLHRKSGMAQPALPPGTRVTKRKKPNKSK